MKKLLIALMVMVLCAGCSNAHHKDVSEYVQEACEMELLVADLNNAHKQYYSYYLPRGISRLDRDNTSNIFVIYGNEAVLNLDVANIIQNTYYNVDEETEQIVNELREVEELVSQRRIIKGTFDDILGNELEYRIIISKLDKEHKYIVMQDDYFVFVASCRNEELNDMVYEMVKILRTCVVEKEEVIADFSNYQDVYRSPSIISLFKDVLPESGSVSETIRNWQDDPAFQRVETEGENIVPDDNHASTGNNVINEVIQEIDASAEHAQEDSNNNG